MSLSLIETLPPAAAIEAKEADTAYDAFLEQQLLETKQEWASKEQVRQTAEAQAQKNLLEFSEMELEDIHDHQYLRMYSMARTWMLANRETYKASEEMCYAILHKGRKLCCSSFAMVEKMKPILAFVGFFLGIHALPTFLHLSLWTILLGAVLLSSVISAYELVSIESLQRSHMICNIPTRIKNAFMRMTPNVATDAKMHSVPIALLAPQQKQTGSCPPSPPSPTWEKIDSSEPVPQNVAALLPSVETATQTNTCENATGKAAPFSVVGTTSALVAIPAPTLKPSFTGKFIQRGQALLVFCCGLPGRVAGYPFTMKMFTNFFSIQASLGTLGASFIELFLFVMINILVCTIAGLTLNQEIFAYCANFLTYVHASSRLHRDFMVLATLTLTAQYCSWVSQNAIYAIGVYYLMELQPDTVHTCVYDSIAYARSAVLFLMNTENVTVNKENVTVLPAGTESLALVPVTMQASVSLQSSTAAAPDVRVKRGRATLMEIVSLVITFGVLHLGSTTGSLHLNISVHHVGIGSWIAEFSFLHFWFLYVEMHHAMLEEANAITLSESVPVNMNELYVFNAVALLACFYMGWATPTVLAAWGQIWLTYLLSCKYLLPRVFKSFKSLLSFREMLEMAKLEKQSPKRWVQLGSAKIPTLADFTAGLEAPTQH